MKGNFILPKIALLVLALGFLAQKFCIADSDLKSGQKDKVEYHNFSESPDVQSTAPAPVAYSQTGQTPTLEQPDQADVPEEAPEEAPEKMDDGGAWDFIKANLTGLLFALLTLLEAVVRLTKTNKDNSILNFIKNILDTIIPNRRVGGGSH